MLRLVELSLAAAAATLFVTESELLDSLRDRLPGVLERGSRCGLCVSFWASGVVLCLAGPEGDPLELLTLWGAAALLAAVWGRLTR